MRFWHVHQWDARAANQGTEVPRWCVENSYLREQIAAGAKIGEAYTEVLYVCAVCGVSKTRRLSGTWSLEALAR